MSLVLDWKKKLGYNADPFQAKILPPVSRHIVGFEKQQEHLNLSLIKNERFGTITGEHGSGKSTFLRWIKEALKQKGVKAHLLDATKTSKQVGLIDAMLTDTTNVFTRRLTLKKPATEKYQHLVKKLQKKTHVLLVDNAGGLTKEGVDLFADLLQKTQSYIFVADTKDKIKSATFTASKLSLKTPSYSEEELVELVRLRIASAGGTGIFPFTDKQLAKLAKDAKSNPAQFLAKCRERAIELSLKVTAPPTPRAVVKTPGKKSRFLSIQVQRGPPAKAGKMPPPIPDDPLPDTPAEHADEDALRELLKDHEK